MAKFNPRELLSTYGSIAALNSNFDDIAELLEQCVFRDGTAPNSMNVNLDMNNFKVQNLGVPSHVNDAARLQDIQDAVAGATTPPFINYTPSGASAVVRTLQSRLDEAFSVKNFGATGDGTTDDTAAINLAIAAAGSAKQTIFFPKGNYKVSVSDGGEKCLTAIPEGVNVYMDSEAWLLPVTSDATTTVFVPLGKNILRVNIDGQSLPEEADPTVDSNWINNSHGIRAYANASHGLGAEDVTIVESKFRNLRYPIQTQGAKRWKILNNKIERTRLSGILMGYIDNYDSVHNLIAGNSFEDIGDTAVAWHSADGGSLAEAAFNTVAYNTAKDVCLHTAGYAFDVEIWTTAQQHHFLFIGNLHEQTRVLPHGVGCVTLGTCDNSAAIGNVGMACLSGMADIGINLTKCTNSVANNNTVSKYRGGGVSIDGGLNVTAQGNNITDCGDGSTSYPALRVALAYATSGVSVIGNHFYNSLTYAYAGADAAFIGAAPIGVAVSDLYIANNVMNSTDGQGIRLDVATGALRRVTLDSNFIINRGEVNPAGVFSRTALYNVGVEQLSILNSTLNQCTRAYLAQNCTGVTIRGGEAKGTLTMALLYNLSGSTGVRISDMRCYQPVTTVASGAAADTIIKDDDQYPLANAVDDAAAATAGVRVGEEYRNGSIKMVRIA